MGREDNKSRSHTRMRLQPSLSAATCRLACEQLSLSPGWSHTMGQLWQGMKMCHLSTRIRDDAAQDDCRCGLHLESQFELSLASFRGMTNFACSPSSWPGINVEIKSTNNTIELDWHRRRFAWAFHLRTTGIEHRLARLSLTLELKLGNSSGLLGLAIVPVRSHCVTIRY